MSATKTSRGRSGMSDIERLALSAHEATVRRGSDSAGGRRGRGSSFVQRQVSELFRRARSREHTIAVEDGIQEQVDANRREQAISNDAQRLTFQRYSVRGTARC